MKVKLQRCCTSVSQEEALLCRYTHITHTHITHKYNDVANNNSCAWRRSWIRRTYERRWLILRCYAAPASPNIIYGKIYLPIITCSWSAIVQNTHAHTYTDICMHKYNVAWNTPTRRGSSSKRLHVCSSTSLDPAMRASVHVCLTLRLGICTYAYIYMYTVAYAYHSNSTALTEGAPRMKRVTEKRISAFCQTFCASLHSLSSISLRPFAQSSSSLPFSQRYIPSLTPFSARLCIH